MSPANRATRRPFTVVCCGRCGALPELAVSEALRETVRRCDHGILVSAACLRGPLTCTGHCPGTMIVLQPCSTDRRPTEPARWVGPINDQDDIQLVREWVEHGQWDCHDLPDRLRPQWPSAAMARRN